MIFKQNTREILPLWKGEQFRLQLLENAVINYGGGIRTLENRVHRMAEQIKLSHPDASRLFSDIETYLRDIAAHT